jgi:hypothetical protein
MHGDLDELCEKQRITEGSSFEGNINNLRDVKSNFVGWQRPRPSWHDSP